MSGLSTFGPGCPLARYQRTEPHSHHARTGKGEATAPAVEHADQQDQCGPLDQLRTGAAVTDHVRRDVRRLNPESPRDVVRRIELEDVGARRGLTPIPIPYTIVVAGTQWTRGGGGGRTT